MIRPQLLLDVNHELFIDNFAGGGGASTGIEMALGRHVDEAINHAFDALGMHRINHPQTVHHCEDVFDIDPRKVTHGRPVGAGWFSPDCKHFSKAKGGQPVSKKIRGLAFVIFRWAKIRMRVGYMENVEEIQTWGPLLPNGKPDLAHKARTWKAFVAALSTGLDPNHPDIPEMLEVLGDTVTKAELVRGFGYNVEWKELRACDYGAPTIRKRLFMIMRCDGMPIVWPKPTHCDPKALTSEARSQRKALADALREDLTTPLKPWRTVAECIDWHIPCNSIFLNKEEARKANCRRPLANSTLRRVACGIDRYVLKAKRPFLVSLTHHGEERVEGVDEPAKTITGAHRGEKALVDATVAPFVSDSVNNGRGVKNHPADEPMRTQCAEVKGGHFELVSAALAHTAHGEVDKNGKKRGRGALPVTEPLPSVLASQDCALVSATIVGSGGPAYQGKPRPVDKPMHTLTTESHSQLVSATIVGAGGRAGQSRPRSTDEPLHTITAKGDTCLAAASLVKLRGDNIGQPSDEPLATISAGGTHHGVVAGTLAAYYGSEPEGQATDEPLRTISTKPRFGFALSEAVAPPMTAAQLIGARRVAAFLREYDVEFDGEFATVGGFVIVDIGLRMLTARELFRAQGFPDKYVIDRAWVVNPKTGAVDEIHLTKEQQIRMCGNSVSPPIAAALVAANSGDMAVWGEKERKNTMRRSYASVN